MLISKSLVFKYSKSHSTHINWHFEKCYWNLFLFQLAPTYSESLIKALDFIKNPRKLCEHVYSMVKELTAKIRTLKLEHRTRGEWNLDMLLLSFKFLVVSFHGMWVFRLIVKSSFLDALVFNSNKKIDSFKICFCWGC